MLEKAISHKPQATTRLVKIGRLPHPTRTVGRGPWSVELFYGLSTIDHRLNRISKKSTSTKPQATSRLVKVPHLLHPTRTVHRGPSTVDLNPSTIDYRLKFT